MAGLAGLLGGYGSDDEDEEQQVEDAGPSVLRGMLAAPSGSLSPSHNSTSAPPAAPQTIDPNTSGGGPQQQQEQPLPPVRVMDGPSTNPEPPPEGQSPPAVGRDDDSQLDSEAGGAGAHLHSAFYLLPVELREEPEGEPNPIIEQRVRELIHAQDKAAADAQAQAEAVALARAQGKPVPANRCRRPLTVMEQLRGDRRWTNPNFLEKMVKHFTLDQYGTLLDPEVWDPKAILEEDYWPALKQQLAARKRPRGGEVKFQSAGQQQPQQQQQAGLPPLSAAAVVAAAAAGAAGLSGQGGSVAPKVISLDPRATAAAQALAAPAKKSKWDK